jgi:hypothetical protein
MFTLLTFLTLVIYEPNDSTYNIEVYDYTEEPELEVVCPEGVFNSDCLEPREKKKETISLEDIQNCAKSSDFIF